MYADDVAVDSDHYEPSCTDGTDLVPAAVPVAAENAFVVDIDGTPSYHSSQKANLVLRLRELGFVWLWRALDLMVYSYSHFPVLERRIVNLKWGVG